MDTYRPINARPHAGVALRLVTAVLLALMFALVKLLASRGVRLVESPFYRQVGSAVCATTLVTMGPGLASLRTIRGGAHVFRMRLFLTTGLLGGFTTFSAFSLDAALMWQRSDYATLGTYVGASVLLSIGGLFFGMAAIRALT